ncbi:hypothetical protein Slin15195_G051830 [Septoria linicola]|uniref:Uncharacterized protein n=1 Tax=Septoria linicola TaxID=215465 RepID=A0A9Q9AP69_9PEZI|nr:hypothetical protein Slin14017_G127330 [Septoria linicola]USW51864.1 hypothetical protein Slin15195_G051830 [Septoria linicola]
MAVPAVRDRAEASDNHSVTTKSVTMKQRPHLLGIARELRDRIYTYALVDNDGKVEVSSKASRLEPAVLMVTRQVRQEARAIYWLKNRFLFTICKFDCLPILNFSFHLVALETNKPHFRFTNMTASLCKCNHAIGINETNWMMWLKHVHAFPDHFPRPDRSYFNLKTGHTSNQASSHNLAVGAFGMVRDMRDMP